MNEKKKDLSLEAGIATIIIWAVVPAVNRLVSDSLSMYIAGGINSICGGIMMLILRKISGSGFNNVKNSNPRYWFLCVIPGAVSVMSTSLFCGVESTRDGMVIAAMLSSLWALFTTIFMVPILKIKANKWFPVACLVGLAGIVLASVSGVDSGVWELLRYNWKCFSLALLSAVTYGISTDYYCLLVRSERDDYTPFVSLADGVIMLVVGLLLGERIGHPSAAAWGGLAFRIVFSATLSSILWNYAMRGKHRTPVILLANLTPVLTAVISCLILGVPLSWQLICGSLLLVVSTVWSNKCLESQSSD